jgi:predicted dehydrogenase
VEKPITDTPAEARELIALAARRERVLQVGHLERFNSAILAAVPYLKSPNFVECNRMAPYRERGTDVNVVLDLMIHDIDIVQTIVGAPIAAIDAVGTPVFSEEIDIANARIRFSNGCVANTTASRVSVKGCAQGGDRLLPRVRSQRPLAGGLGRGRSHRARDRHPHHRAGEPLPRRARGAQVVRRAG